MTNTQQKLEYLEAYGKGHPKLYYAGALFYRHSNGRGDEAIYWRCVQYHSGNCTVQVSTRNESVVHQTQSPHLHELITTDDFRCRQALAAIKRRVISQRTMLPRVIYDEERTRLQQVYELLLVKIPFVRITLSRSHLEC